MPLKMHHVALKVRDLAQAERFYVDLLGLAVMRRWPDPEGDGDRSLWLELGEGTFLALERAGSPPLEKAEDASGFHLLALQITPEDRRLLEARCGIAGFPTYHATDYTFYIRDPEGNRIGFSHWPHPRPPA